MSLESDKWQQEKYTLEILSGLSYRTGELTIYLQEIILGISKLLQLDWSVVTLCDDDTEKLLASSIDIGDLNQHIYSLHGTLTCTVVKTGQSLVVSNTQSCTEYGKAPSGYQAYLGVPLRTPQGKVMGTICSFQKQPRQFTPEEVRIAELFAERAATAIDNYYLYQQQLQFNHILEAEVERRTEELRITQAQLVEQERLAAIGEFAACIIHEIRNPFTTVKMWLNFCTRLDLSPSAKERLSLTLSEGERLERLLKEILLYAKPQTLQLQKIDVCQLILEMLPFLGDMPEAEGKQLEFEPEITQVQIMGDEDKLKQIFINIVRNAFEAISQGETVKLQINTKVNLNQVCIHIHNGGEPIPPEVLPQLTQPFFSTKTSGTGLGLAITKRIVELHGGNLVIKSNSAIGTKISVQLPIL
ncbi:MAG: ATP-binding protein [Nostocaceae cyanobacterium]|nr:ATP-binding protein [Nostocaceae cyanobacterium]